MGIAVTPEGVNQNNNSLYADPFAPKLNNQDYETLVKNYGYNVTLERAIECPCANHGLQSTQTSCVNCHGHRWLFLPPERKIIVLQGMNRPTKYEVWSEENIGTVKVTAKYADRLAFMDRITLLDSVSIFSQQMTVEILDNTKTAKGFTVYTPTTIKNAFIFIDVDKPLKPLVLGTDYFIEGRTVKMSVAISKQKNVSITLRYEFHPEYHVVDVQRDIMTQERAMCANGNLTVEENFPVLAIARIASNVLREDAS